MKSILIAIVIFIAGLFGGYYFAANKAPVTAHVMPDGSLMSDTMGGMLAGLEDKAGDDFDKAFITEMVVHHEGAVSMAEQALRQAKHSEIKEMAENIISAQTGEIATMRSWLQSWYGIK